MNSEERCHICLSSDFGPNHDDPLPVEMKGDFYPEMCPLHKMHMSCARNNAKAERMRHREYLNCPACRTQYTTRDLQILLPLRRKLALETTLEPLDDKSDFIILLLERYNPSLHLTLDNPRRITRGQLKFTFAGSALPTTRVLEPSTGTQRVDTGPLQHPSIPQTPHTLNFWIDRLSLPQQVDRLPPPQQPQQESELRSVLQATRKAKAAIDELGTAVSSLQRMRSRTIERRITRSQTVATKNLLNRMKAKVSGARGCLGGGLSKDLIEFMLELDVRL